MLSLGSNQDLTDISQFWTEHGPVASDLSDQRPDSLVKLDLLGRRVRSCAGLEVDECDFATRLSRIATARMEKTGVTIEDEVRSGRAIYGPGTDDDNSGFVVVSNVPSKWLAPNPDDEEAFLGAELIDASLLEGDARKDWLKRFDEKTETLANKYLDNASQDATDIGSSPASGSTELPRGEPLVLF